MIIISNLTKLYKLYDQHLDRLKEALNPFGRKYSKEVYVLKNISLQIRKGETVGIIGQNGAGKSTLLKIITGVLNPTKGNVEINGRISALLELGAGFNPEYTGIENIYLNGTLRGFSEKEMDERMDSIIQFAGIGDYVNQPVKYYSSGMFVRLAFAVAINVDPDILIIDEALSVGDIRFQQKCFRKIEKFKKSKTVLFVSHDMAAINKYCERVIWMENGEIKAQGTPLEISKKYRSFMIDSNNKIEIERDIKNNNKRLDDGIISSQFSDSKLIKINDDLDISGDGKVEIVSFGLFDCRLQDKQNVIQSGQKIKLVFRFKLKKNIADLIIGFTIRDQRGNIVTQANSYVLGKNYDLKIDRYYNVFFEFKLPALATGTYTISPAIASGTLEDHVQHCWVHDAIVFDFFNKKQHLLEGYVFCDSIKIDLLE